MNIKKKDELPLEIPVFPLSNFIIFPSSTVPLNIFEPRYIQMIDDSMSSHRCIGMVQPKNKASKEKPDLYSVGCLGKITSFNETEDGRYLIILNGIQRFEIINEVNKDKLYRSCNVNYKKFNKDHEADNQQMNSNDLQTIFKNLKLLFEKQGYSINWKEIEKQSLDQTINTLSMASPFSLEEKQILLETIDLKDRKKKLEEILNTYVIDNFSNTTLQ